MTQWKVHTTTTNIPWDRITILMDIVVVVFIMRVATYFRLSDIYVCMEPTGLYTHTYVHSKHTHRRRYKVLSTSTNRNNLVIVFT